MRLIQSIFFSLFFCQTASAASFTVTLREFGFNRQSCTADVQQVAQRFAELTGKVILSSGCVAPDTGHIDATGKFTYASAERVETITSDVREYNRIDGYYRSPAECNAALLREQEVFTRLTRLTPYVSYCYKANYISAPRYRARFDTVGKSPISKYSKAVYWNYGAANPEQLVADVVDMVRSRGGEVVAAMTDRDFRGNLVSFDYYSLKEIHLHLQEVLFWKNADDCHDAIADLNQTWDDRIVKSTFHCSATVAGTSRMLQVYTSANLSPGFDFKSETYVTDYPTQDACHADAGRIEAALIHSGTMFLGSACGQNQNGSAWKIHVFSR